MNATTKYFILATAFLGFVSCAQQQAGYKKNSNVKVEDHFNSTFTVRQLRDKLEFSFTKMKPDSFAQIFIDWNRIIKPNTIDFINQSETIYAVYNVFKEFYKPHELLKLGDWEWGNDLNANCKYVVIQNKIFYSVSPTFYLKNFDWEKSTIDSIDNFRPPINLDANEVLYLTNDYADAINQFLAAESKTFGEGSSKNPARTEGESQRRYEILRSHIPILRGHWGGYWHLETHPEIRIIIFNKTLNKAKIYFRVGYQGGEATLKKRDNGWTIMNSKATWIE